MRGGRSSRQSPALREAEDSWRSHLRSCAICQAAERARTPYCPTGSQLFKAVGAAKRLQDRIAGR